MTVRIVPSTGLRTALKATLTLLRKATAMSSAVTGSWAPTRPSAMPRRIWLVMTPELPRAPMSEPWVIALATAAMSESAGSAATSRTTVPSVSDMFVPVSPSGTGKTLSLLMSSDLSATAWAATGKHERITLAIMSGKSPNRMAGTTGRLGVQRPGAGRVGDRGCYLLARRSST